jgi:hypothetical protein
VPEELCPAEALLFLKAYHHSEFRARLTVPAQLALNFPFLFFTGSCFQQTTTASA